MVSNKTVACLFRLHVQVFNNFKVSTKRDDMLRIEFVDFKCALSSPAPMNYIFYSDRNTLYRRTTNVGFPLLFEYCVCVRRSTTTKHQLYAIMNMLSIAVSARCARTRLFRFMIS
uniref:Uncharacterized protein n=1 Tax=Pseudo-nitzschia australis TaxID=44445 RepID=A0A7S4AA99_9STRA